MARLRPSGRRTICVVALCLSTLLATPGQARSDETRDTRVSDVWPNFTREEMAWESGSLEAANSESRMILANTEPGIAIDPGNPALVAAIYTGAVRQDGKPLLTCPRRYSVDGGRTWQSATPEPPLDTPHGNCANALVAAAGGGRFYSITMTYDDNEIESHEYLHISDDGGRTWRVGALIGNNHFDDVGRGYKKSDTVCGPKRMAVDTAPNSRWRGRIYVLNCANEQLVGGKNGFALTLRYSDDGGKTLSVPKLVQFAEKDGSPYEQFSPSEILTDPRGGLTLVYALDRKAEGYDLAVVQSADGGVTFEAPRMVPGTKAPATRMGIIPDPRWKSFKQWQHSYNVLSVRAAQTPDGRIWIAYSANTHPDRDCAPDPNGRFCVDSDVLLTTSADGGRTWTQPVDFARGPKGSDQWMPTLTAHEDGVVSIAWLDKRLHRDNLSYDAYYTNTRDGVRFLKPVRLSSVSSPLAAGDDLDHADDREFYNINFLGDWHGSAVAGRRFSYIWSDMRAGASSRLQRPKEIWQATVTLCQRPAAPSRPQPLCPADVMRKPD